MVDISAQRAALAEVLEPLSVPVFAAAPHGTMPAQFVLLGMPSWHQAELAMCAYRVRWDVMVCVARTGTNDTLTALALEGLWPEVLQVLATAIHADDFASVCWEAEIKEATFDVVTIQGADYPAQVIAVEMMGEGNGI